jgi:predicted DsbA family dithiol-disulfide isomerase
VPEEEARATLDSDAYADAVRADIRRARMLGVQGVPFFAIDEKYGVSGAQPAEVLKDVLAQAWADEHPLIKVSGSSEDDANACEGDTCAI